MGGLSNEIVLGLIASVSAIAGSLATFLLGYLKLRGEGLTAAEAGRLAERKQFRDEVMAVAAAAREAARQARHDADALLARNSDLIRENDGLRERIDHLEAREAELTAEVGRLKARLAKYEKRRR